MNNTAELTLVANNPKLHKRKLRFRLTATNRETGHYVSYRVWPAQGVQHWYLFHKNRATANSLAIKEMQGFYRPAHLTPPA